MLPWAAFLGTSNFRCLLRPEGRSAAAAVIGLEAYLAVVLGAEQGADRGVDLAAGRAADLAAVSFEVRRRHLLLLLGRAVLLPLNARQAREVRYRVVVVPVHARRVKNARKRQVFPVTTHRQRRQPWGRALSPSQEALLRAVHALRCPPCPRHARILLRGLLRGGSTGCSRKLTRGWMRQLQLLKRPVARYHHEHELNSRRLLWKFAVSKAGSPQ